MGCEYLYIDWTDSVRDDWSAIGFGLDLSSLAALLEIIGRLFGFLQYHIYHMNNSCSLEIYWEIVVAYTRGARYVM